MKKKVTQVDRLRFRMRASMQEWQLLLGWNEQAYCDFQYECGCQYMQAYLPGDVYAVDEMLASAQFWGWWKVQWMIREEQYSWALQCYDWKHAAKRNSKKYGDGYVVLHDPVELAKGTGPYGRAIDDSYSRELVPELGKRAN